MRKSLLSIALVIAAVGTSNAVHAQSRSDAVEICKEAVIARGFGDGGFDGVDAVRLRGDNWNVTGYATSADRGRAGFNCNLDGRRISNLSVDEPRERRRDRDDRRRDRDDRRGDRMPDIDARVHCESKNYGRNRCDMDTRSGVRLVEQTSNTRCRRDVNWGFDAGSVWVDKGCSARFEAAGR